MHHVGSQPLGHFRPLFCSHLPTSKTEDCTSLLKRLAVPDRDISRHCSAFVIEVPQTTRANSRGVLCRARRRSKYDDDDDDTDSDNDDDRDPVDEVDDVDGNLIMSLNDFEEVDEDAEINEATEQKCVLLFTFDVLNCV